MTLKQVFREFVLAKQQREDERDRDIAHAWHVAALSRQDKLPPLKTLLSGGRTTTAAGRDVQTMAEKRSMLQLISQNWGLPLRKVTLTQPGTSQAAS